MATEIPNVDEITAQFKMTIRDAAIEALVPAAALILKGVDDCPPSVRAYALAVCLLASQGPEVLPQEEAAALIEARSAKAREVAS